MQLYYIVMCPLIASDIGGCHAMFHCVKCDTAVLFQDDALYRFFIRIFHHSTVVRAGAFLDQNLGLITTEQSEGRFI